MNKKELIDKKPSLKRSIFNYEIIILKFLLNFLTIKYFDYSNISLISQTNMTREELIIFGKNYRNNCENYKLIKTNINLSISNQESPQSFHADLLKSKYLIFKMKLEILNTIDNIYLYFYKSDRFNENCDENDNHSEKNTNHFVFLLLFNYFFLIFKDFQTNSDKSLILKELIQKFDRVLQTFIKNKNKIIPCNIINDSIENFDFLENNNSLLEKYHKYFQNIFNIITKKKFSPMKNNFFLQINIDLDDYLKKFQSFDNRKYSMYSKQIKILIQNKKK